MRNRILATSALAGCLLLAACAGGGGGQAATTTTTASTPGSPSTVQTSASSLSASSQQQCAAARNELAESGIQDVMEQVLAGQQLPVVAFATPVDNHTRVPPGAAEPQVADAIIAVNKAVAELQGVGFTLWTSTQTAALATAYKQLTSVCGLDGS